MERNGTQYSNNRIVRYLTVHFLSVGNGHAADIQRFMQCTYEMLYWTPDHVCLLALETDL